MEDLSASDLSLNLISTEVAATFSRPHNKKRISGDRASRVKQRKQARFDRAKEKHDGPILSASENVTGKSPNLKRKNDYADNDGSGHRHDNFKKRKGDGIISSLFRKNPDIPDIASSNVETVKEKVFTGKTFKDLPIHPYLVSNLEEKHGFQEMTEIQRRAIPVLLGGRDALVKSQTGSGKTLSYAVPIIQSLQSRKIKVHRNDGPYAVVIVPTRELALQSYDTFLKLLRTFIWIVPGCLMGGENRKAEKSRLRKGVNILVATPGRLLDHIMATSSLSLRRVQWLVIDEADRLLELGYERDIAQILNALKSQCADPPQTVLLSATLSEGVERLSSISLNDPDHVSVVADATPEQHATAGPGPVSEAGDLVRTDDPDQVDTYAVPSQLRQQFVVTPCKQRLVTLAALVLWKCQFSKPGSKMLVFMSTQDSVEFHSNLFTSVLASKPKDTIGKLQALAMGATEEDVGDSSDEDNDDEEEMSTGNDSGSKQGKKLKIFQLHGEMSQKDRSRTFSEFSQASTGVLFCTDVAARGLDLPHVDWIVQYTSPGSTVDYIHRVGRTARAGSQGHSLLFLMPAESAYIQELNRHKISVSQLKPAAMLQHLLSHIDQLPSPDDPESKRQKPVTQEEAATYLQDRFEECVLRDQKLHGLAGRGFQSFIRAYATYSKEVKDYFKVSELHLGHVAKSFALREAPGKVSGVTTKVTRTNRNNKEKPWKRPLSFKQAMLNEYSSGLQRGGQTKGRQSGNLKPKKKKKLKK